MNILCGVCNKECIPNDISSGYAIDKDNLKVCYQCCAKADEKQMKETGKILLYLTNDKVTNWPGTLGFKIYGLKKSHHNIGGKRFDFWFNYDGFVWHGYQIGYNTQIAHCKRTKDKVK